ncbi:hypothetical protein [Amycolatopsis thermophila]|uniref:DUF222 domain-containing protein n=1 Tax=Amycolatopsis thermophila TaxID=206084 RepID=A0ABU0ERK4_9PSEU|nr:hypothetical protein [Amycolatopsis thermophila]MDQ0377929.1 hypothetical protein [Amycolatopsis thermophila]
MTTHDEQREDQALGYDWQIRSEMAELRDHFELPESMSAADIVLQLKLMAEHGWRKQGAADPDVIGRAAHVLHESGCEDDCPGHCVEDAHKLASAGVLAGQGAADDDTTRLRAENEQLRWLHAEASWYREEMARAGSLLLIAQRDGLADELGMSRNLPMGSLLARVKHLREYAETTRVSQPQPEPEPLEYGARWRGTEHWFATEDERARYVRRLAPDLFVETLTRPAEVSRPQEARERPDYPGISA